MFNVRKVFKNIGPGVITGAADDDPSGIATYSQTGTKFGYTLLWLAPFTLPLMFAVQEMSARLAMVTGRGLSDIIRHHISRRTVLVLSLLFFVVNTINIGANLGAMAAAMQLVMPGSFFVYLVLMAMIVIGLEFFTSYRQYTAILRWLILTLLAYVITAFVTPQDWGAVLRATFLPQLVNHPDMWLMIVAILGTTIAPYLFFWQASEEVEEEISAGRKDIRARRGVTKAELTSMRADVGSGMVLSNLIMFFIILTTAATLHRAGVTDITSAAQAAAALKPLTSNFAFLLFSLGIIGTGLIGVPILAGSASFAMAEVFGWKEGLEKRFGQARPFHITMLAAIVLGAVVNLFGVPAIDFLIAAAVLNGLLAPILLWYIIRLADRREVVGEHRSPPVVRVLGWGTFVFMALAGVVYLADLIGLV